MVRTKKAKILAIICTLGMLATMFIVPFTASAATAMGVSYNVHGQSYGTQAVKSNGELAGTVGASKRVEAIAVALTNPVSAAAVSYQVYQGKAWTTPVSSGFAGVTGKSLMDQKFRLTLSGAPGYALEYRVQGQSYGWTAWATVQNGTALASAPSLGTLGKRIEAVEIKVVAVTPVSKATQIVAKTTTPIAVGAVNTFVFEDSTGAAVATPAGATYSVSPSTAIVDANGTFVATAAGTYSVTATVNGVALTPATVKVYNNTVSSIVLTAASTSVVKDAAATDVITATAYDANGFVVGNFDGSATIASSAVGSGSFVGFATTESSNPNSAKLTFVNGVATVTYMAPASTVSATSATLVTSTIVGNTTYNVNYGSIVLTLTAPSATAIKLTPATATVSSNANGSDNVNVSVVDAAGNAIDAQSEYFTFTVSGTGATIGETNSPTTYSNYEITGALNSGNDGYWVLPINTSMGDNGTITVTASAPGFTTATTTFTELQTAAPAKIVVTSTPGTISSLNGLVTGAGVTLPTGTAFIEYTVQLEDANGNAVTQTTPDSLAISDNVTSLAVGGAIGYRTVLNGQPNSLLGYSNATHSASISISRALSGGTYSFIVLNTAVGTTNPTITIKDSTETGFASVTAPYTYVTSAASKLVLTDAGNTGTVSVEAGQTVTIVAQVEDVSGNAISAAGDTVDLCFGDSEQTTGANSTINGIAFTSTNLYTTTTDSTGKVTVSVAVPSSATGNFYLKAYGVGSTGTYATAASIKANVIAPASFATSLAVCNPSGVVLTTLPASSELAGTAIFGTGASTDELVALNAVGSPLTTTGDTLKVTSSNGNVLSVATQNECTSGSAMPVVKAMNIGTATITITDVTNPSVPALVYTYTVTANSAVGFKIINPDGTTGAYTFSATGISGGFTIDLVDAGGNVVSAGATPLNIVKADVLTALGISATGIRTTAGGSDVTPITFTQGMSSIVIYVDAVTANEVTAPVSETTYSFT